MSIYVGFFDELVADGTLHHRDDNSRRCEMPMVSKEGGTIFESVVIKHNDARREGSETRQKIAGSGALTDQEVDSVPLFTFTDNTIILFAVFGGVATEAPS